MNQDGSSENNQTTNEPVLPERGNERLLAFSDGVFAITITLLVLEVKVPEIAENLVATELSKELWHLLPKIFSHILSFIVLGLYWIAHHNMFTHIKRHDHILLWLNIAFLMCVASIPFPTGLLGTYHELQISIVIYAGVLALTGIFLNLIWWYAVKYSLIQKDANSDFINFVARYICVAPIVYLIAIGTSFLNLAIAKFLLIAATIFYIIPNPYHRKYYKQLLRRFEQ
jgi:uncharacterized membrane protein